MMNMCVAENIASVALKILIRIKVSAKMDCVLSVLASVSARVACVMKK